MGFWEDRPPRDYIQHPVGVVEHGLLVETDSKGSSLSLLTYVTRDPGNQDFNFQ